MRKGLLIGSLVIITLASLGIAGYVYAQSEPPPEPEYPYGYGMMGKHWSGRPSGMMGGWGDRSDFDDMPMHSLMISALAQSLGISPEELEARHDAGETIWEIAQSLGLDITDLQERMEQARNQAIDQAVEQGLLSADQANSMRSRMNQMWNLNEYPDGLHCNGFNRAGGRGMNWFRAPSEPSD